MSDWKEYKLGDVCAIVGRIGFRGYTTDDLTNNPKDGAISLSPTNIVAGEIDLSKPTYIKWPKYYESPEIMLEKDDIVLVKTGSSIGRTARIREVKHPMTLNPQFVVLKKVKVDNVFLSYVLKSQPFQASLKAITVGSAIPTLSQKNLAKISINMPEEKIQKAIARVLLALDDKIEVNRRINENLEQQAQALFKSWFVDFEPFKDQPFIESELGMIPQGWRVECLNEFGKIVCGKTPSKAESLYYGGNIPFVKIPDMHNNIFVLHSEDCLSDLGDKSQVGKRIPPYSVLVSCIATVGLVGMNVQTCHTNQQINTIIPNSIEYRYYLYQKLVTLKEYLVNLGRGGTATLNVNTRQFGNIRIVRPSDKVLCEYHQRVSCLFDKIEINSSESRRLAELRDTLLPKLMSGEINVNNL